MFNIGQYISKLNNKRLNHITKINNISVVINKISGLNVGVNDIKIRNGVLYIDKLNSVGRNEIFIKKSLLIKEINNISGESISDIR